MKPTFLPIVSRSLSAATVCALLGASAFAQVPAPAAAPGAAATTTAPAEKPKPLSAEDEKYVRTAMNSFLFLVQMAKTLPASTDMSVATQNRLRDTTVKDMTAAQGALGKIVEAHGLKLPTELVGNDKSDVERAAKAFAKPPMKGFENKPALDWAGELLKVSKRLDHETEQVGKTSQDADLKTFASNYGPSIRNVYTSAESLEKALKTKKK